MIEDADASAAGLTTQQIRDYRVNIVELRRRVGNRREVVRSLVSPGWSLESASVPAGVEVDAALELESVSGGLTALGVLEAAWTGPCRRCLDEVAGELHLEIDEVFEVTPTDGETYPIDGDLIDLLPMVRDAVLLGLPLAPICRLDCPGPAPDRFEVEVEGDEDTAPLDPRWAALDDLRAELSAGDEQ